MGRMGLVRLPTVWLLTACAALGVAGSIDVQDASAASLPPAPFMESVSPQGLGGLVSWSPDPASAEVSTYSVQAMAAPGTKLPSGCSTVTVSVSSSNSAALVNGLCVGAAYVARVSAVNAAGKSAWSSNSNPFAPFPAQVPGAPLITSVFGRQQSLVVSWSPPSTTGGAALSGYVVKASAGGSTVSTSVGPSASSATLTGLTDGTSYSVSVVAQSSVGSSSAASGSGVPSATYTPGAPEQITAVPSGTGEVDLTWQPPADTGGASISAYQITYEEVVQNESGQWVPAPEAKPTVVSATGTATSLAVSGLTPTNAFWSFSIAAVSSAGVGTSGSAGQPVSPLTSTSSSAVVLTSATMTALSSDENEQLTWTTPVPTQVTALKVGQVILAGPAAAAPQGLLDTVESVTKESSGSYVVGIAQAALSQAFTGLSLASTLNPLATSSEPATTFHPALPGIRLIKPALSVSFSRELVLGIEYGSGPLKVSGELDVTPSVGVDIAVTTGFLDVPNGADVTASASVGVKAALSATLEGSLSRKIGEIDGDPEYYQIGPVPVVVVPKIPIYLNASGKITTQVTASIKIGAQASWSSHQPGTLSVKNTSTPLTVSGNPLENLSASASVGFAEQPQLDLYDATGPNFEAAESLQATLNPDPGAGQDYFSLVPSLNLKAGWDIDLLSFHASLDAQIAHLTFPSFVIAKPPGAFLTVTPASPSVPVGGSEQFKATRSDGQSFPVTWTVLGGAGDTISSSGLLQAVAPAGRTLDVIATDSKGAIGETTVTVGKAFTTPQKLAVVSAHDGRSATLSWQPPTSTGGTALSSYTIVTDPATTTQTVPASSTSSELTGLTPGVTYVVSVYATNTGGLQSSPATVSFTPAVTCSITWTGATSTAWSTASNWAPERVPNSDDLVCVSGATVKLTAAATVYGLTLQSSTLNTSAGITVTDLMSFEGSMLEGSGTTAVMLSAGGTLASAGSTLSGVHLVNHGQGVIAAGSSLTVDGTSTLENASSLTIGDGASIDWDGTTGGQLINAAGATLKYSGGTEGAAIYAPVRNNGTINAAAGTLTLYATVSQTSTGAFTGAGTIVVQSTYTPVGTGVNLTDATVNGSITGPGTVTIPTGATVTMANGSSLSTIHLVNKGNLTLGPGSASIAIDGATTLENDATVTLDDGTYISWDGNTSGKITNNAGATIDYPGGSEGAAIYAPVRNNGTINATSGMLTLYGPVSQTSTGSFTGAGTIVVQSTYTPVGTGVNLTDATVNGSITGPGTVTIPTGATVTMANGSSLSTIHLVNKGNLTLGPGPANVTFDGATTLENDATVTLDDGTYIDWDGTSGKLVNATSGTIDYPGGSEGATIYLPFDNHGAVTVGAGALFVDSGNTEEGSDTGSYSASAGGKIDFEAGERALGSTFSFQGPGQFEVSGGVVEVPGAASISNLAVTGSGVLAGPGSVTVPSGGSLTLGSNASLAEDLTLVNDGTGALQSGSSTNVQGGSTLENAGTLQLADGSNLSYEYSPDAGVLLNEAGGTITYAGGTEGASIDVLFDNYGTVAANVGTRGGTLHIYAGNTTSATDTGKYSATSGGTIELDGGERVLGSTFSFEGPGQLRIAGGTVAVPGTASISNLALAGGGELAGPGTVTVPSGGLLTIGANAYLTNDMTLVNNGTGTVQTGNAVEIEGGSKLKNAGTLQLADGSNLSYVYSPDLGQLLNESGGTITYAGGTEGASIDVLFDNYGTVAASVGTRGGTLHIYAGNTTSATDTGKYSATSGGTIELDGGERVLGSTFSFAGPGQLRIAGGTVAVPGTASVSNLALAGGGELAGPGTVTVPSSGLLTIGADAYLTNDVTLVNNGAGTVQTGNAVEIQGGSKLKNTGTLQLADGASISYVYSPDLGQLLNESGGTITYAGGTEGASIDVLFDNYGTVAANVGTRGGTLAVEAGDTSKASDSGIYSASAGGAIDFNSGTRTLGSKATLTGPGTIEVGGGTVVDSAIANGAALVLQAGKLEVTPQASGKLSSIVENAGGTMQFDVSSATPTVEPARLSVTGGAALGGTFVLEPTSGFVPTEGGVLYLLGWGSVTGDFSSVTVPAGFVDYAVNASSKALTATAID
jgi:Fibronectin type III domain